MVKTKIVIVLSLVVCLLVYFVSSPLAMGAFAKTWGNSQVIKTYLVVGLSTEIPAGNYSYVFQEATGLKSIPGSQWEAMLAGDMSLLANQIRQQIPGSEPIWISVSWDSVEYQGFNNIFVVGGFRVDAIVKNTGTAGLTGGEIVLIIAAIAFLVGILTICLTGTYSAWRLLDAANQIGPWMEVIVAILILFGCGFLLFTFFGGHVEYKSGRGKSKTLKVGKAKESLVPWF